MSRHGMCCDRHAAGMPEDGADGLASPCGPLSRSDLTTVADAARDVLAGVALARRHPVRTILVLASALDEMLSAARLLERAYEDAGRVPGAVEVVIATARRVGGC